MPINTRYRRYLIFLLYILLLVAGSLAGNWLSQFVDIEVRPRNEPTLHVAIMTAAAIFVVASALPFVPGAEIGFGLMMMFGGKIAILVYVCMLIALMIAFLIGRCVPTRFIVRFFSYLGFKRSYELVIKLDSFNTDERLALLTANTPRRALPVLLRHRYLALMLLFNLPGNSVLGGGGGIAFTAGLSGLFSYSGFIAAVIIAIAPVPLYFFLVA